MTIGTSQLAVGILSGSSNTDIIFTVPAGETYILKTIGVQNRVTAGQAVYIGVNPAGIPDTLYPVHVTPSALNMIEWFTGWFVLKPGDRVLGISGDPSWYIISGTKLAGVA